MDVHVPDAQLALALGVQKSSVSRCPRVGNDPDLRNMLISCSNVPNPIPHQACVQFLSTQQPTTLFIFSYS